jgi:hypothetical protein
MDFSKGILVAVGGFEPPTADMSRATTVAKLLDLLIEIILEASVGDKSKSRAPPE